MKFMKKHHAKEEAYKMKTTLELLNEVIELGFDQNKALMRIDALLDKKLGIELRKPLSDEILSDDVYNDILKIFSEEYVCKK